MSVSKEQLAAYADGELEGAELAEVEAAIAADPALAAEVEAHRALKAKLSAHFAPLLDQPVPDRLTGLLKGGGEGEGGGGGAEVVDFAAARETRAKRALPHWTWIAAPALAASLVLAVVLNRPGEAPGPGYASGALEIALNDQLVATQPASAPTHILLSFKDKQGELCRGFSGAAQSGIACRDARGWRLAKVLGGAPVEAGEYRMAGSSAPALMAAMQDMAAGPALDARAEAAAKADGWRE